MMLLLCHKGNAYCVYGTYHREMPTRDPMQVPEPAWFHIERVEHYDKDVTEELPSLDMEDIAGYARDICEAGGDE